MLRGGYYFVLSANGRSEEEEEDNDRYEENRSPRKGVGMCRHVYFLLYLARWIDHRAVRLRSGSDRKAVEQVFESQYTEHTFDVKSEHMFGWTVHSG